MADVKMPKSQPCQFDRGWAGRCGKPTDNGWCTEHEAVTCVVCGNHAVRECDYTGSMPLVCGAKLCADCEHEPYNPDTAKFPSKHLNKSEYKKALAETSAAEQK